jgi:hypothetical protein
MVRQFGIPALVVAALAVALLTAVPAQAGGFGCGSYVWSNPYPADLTPLYSVGTCHLTLPCIRPSTTKCRSLAPTAMDLGPTPPT